MLKVKETVERDLVDVFMADPKRTNGLNAGDAFRAFVSWANEKGKAELKACPFCERRYVPRKAKAE